MLICKISAFLLLFIFLIECSARGEQPGPRVRMASDKATGKTEILEQKLHLADSLVSAGVNQGVLYAESAYNLADSLNKKHEQAQAAMLLGVSWKLIGDNSRSVSYLFRSMTLFQSLNDKYGVAEAYKNLGETYRAATNFGKAVHYLHLSLRIYQQLNDSSGLAGVYNRLAAVSYELLMAKLPFKDSIVPLEQKKLLRQQIESDSIFQQRVRLTRYYLSLSSALAGAKQLDEVRISNDIILGAMETTLMSFDEAGKIYNKILREIQITGIRKDLPLVMHNIAVLYLMQDDYRKAISYGLQSYRLAKESNIRIYIILSSGILYRIYSHQGDYKNAIVYQEVNASQRIKFYKNDITLIMKMLQTSYEDALKEKEIAERKKKLSSVIILFSAILIITASFITMLFKKQKQQRQLIEQLNLKNSIISEQVKKLGELNSERNKFFSVIAHDLRNPLSGFHTLTQIIENDLKTLDKEDIAASVSVMKESAARIYKLLENLLTWSRMQNGLIPYRESDVNLKELIRHCCELCSSQDNYKNIRIQQDIDETLFVKADQQMLETILRNLISNAIKFTPDNGLISVKTKITGNQNVNIAVIDTGIGMKKELIDKLFNPDDTVTRKGTRGETGSGLGLVLCKDFLIKHNSSLEIYSTEGEGSTFSFELPLA